MKKILLSTILCSTVAFSSAYRLPENSINSVALSGAYIANAKNADSSYYNPANMVFNDNKAYFEGDLLYVNLSKINYKDSRGSLFSGKTKEENLFAPALFYSSKDYKNFRYGLSLTVPGGLSKRWESAYQKLFAQEFTLKIVEFNPSFAYKISDEFAIGAGFRVIYSDGIVKSDGDDITQKSKKAINKPAIRDMKADTTEYGYNLALTFKPDEFTNISATYRSNVNLNHKGNAKLYLSGTKLYDGGASVDVPLPAVLSIATSYDFGGTVVELEWDKTFWSKYKVLDFQFNDKVPVALSAFDTPIDKKWKDSDAFRIGLTHNLNSKLTLMGGFAIDNSPIDDRYLGFELPDSDAKIYSAGLRYNYQKNLSFGASILYDQKDKRSLKNDTINGEFKDASALLISTGFTYSY